MNTFFKAYWKQITVLAVFIIIIIAVYMYARKQGVNSVAPSIPGDDPNAPLTDAEKAKAKSIGDRLNDDINDWDGGAFRDWPAYNDLASASNRVFVATCNYYREQFGVALKQDMQGEWYSLDQAPLVNNTDPIQIIYQRMAELNAGE